MEEEKKQNKTATSKQTTKAKRTVTSNKPLRVSQPTSSTKNEKKVAKKNNLTVSVYNLDGKETKTITLPQTMFAEPENKQLIAQYVRVYLHNQRQGTVSAKTRSEVIGTTKKVYRQKGTGRARHGARKAPIFVGGGVTFGPRPRIFEKDINKKQKKKALMVALSMQARQQAIKVLEDKAIAMKPKTKTMAACLQAMNVSDKALLVLAKVENNGIVQSTRNIPFVDIIQASTINPYEVLNHKHLIFTETGLQALQDHFTKKA
ncbi:50S ribosomal protein L4 [Candidatus Woesebacteria bacterium]|nr:50S ribosomal protein L4 [Candidatus Woesebacteria bacterium]